MKFGPNQKFGPVNSCIYCGDQSPPLTDEHIVPLSLGGTYILVRASCKVCQKKINVFETHLSDHLFKSLRVHQTFPSRGKRPKPTELYIRSTRTESTLELVPVDEHPGVIILPVFEPHSFPEPREKSGDISMLGHMVCTTNHEAREKLQALQNKDGYIGIPLKFEPLQFARLLAKIAHGFAFLQLGDNLSDMFLPALILGDTKNASSLVGTSSTTMPHQEKLVHDIVLDVRHFRGKIVAYAQIKLFAHLSGDTPPPVYEVVVGLLKSPQSNPVAML